MYAIDGSGTLRAGANDIPGATRARRSSFLPENFGVGAADVVCFEQDWIAVLASFEFSDRDARYCRRQFGRRLCRGAPDIETRCDPFHRAIADTLDERCERQDGLRDDCGIGSIERGEDFTSPRIDYRGAQFAAAEFRQCDEI